MAAPQKKLIVLVLTILRGTDVVPKATTLRFAPLRLVQAMLRVMVEQWSVVLPSPGPLLAPLSILGLC